MVVKLTKGETNELLNKISEDNFEYGLIFKLIYVYAKEAKTILGMKWSQIDFEKDIICFKEHKFPLLGFIKSELLKYREMSNDDYVFIQADDPNGVEYEIDSLRKKLRYYTSVGVRKLDVSLKIKHSVLSINDLRRLRGQHLLLDGVRFDIVMKLYLQENGTSTQFKRYLDYDAIMSKLFSCSSLEECLSKYTSLNIYDFDEYREDVHEFVVSNGGDLEFMISVSENGLDFYDCDDKEICTYLTGLFDNGELDCLVLLGRGEYLLVDGWSFVSV